jgi:probable F420-dependent oxidoreductase
LQLLAFAAAVTDRIRLGTAVILAPLRVPVELAKALATLDHLSGGRLIVGLGLGGQAERYPAFGLAAEGRVRRFDETVRLLVRLWTEPAVTDEGEFWQLRDVAVSPSPVQQPHPPIWLGGSAEPALRRAARVGDGWIGAGSSTTASFADGVAVVRDELAELGRPADRFAIAKRVYVTVDDDADRALARLQAWFGSFYGDAALAERVAVWGPPVAVAEGIAAVMEAGAGTAIVNPIDEHEAQAARLAAEVLPQLGWSAVSEGG